MATTDATLEPQRAGSATEPPRAGSATEPPRAGNATEPPRGGTATIRSRFLNRDSRRDLIEFVRDGSATPRLARRAKALVLLDNGINCETTAEVLSVDNDTVRTWYQEYQDDGIAGLTSGICPCEGGGRQRAADSRATGPDRTSQWLHPNRRDH
jgi:hypothetical protein